MHRGRRPLLALTALLGLVACKDPGPADPATATDSEGATGGPTGPEPTTGEPAENTVVIPANRAVDLLFVVDNSESMAEEQQRLAAALPVLVGILEAADVRADYRIGFTTTDVGNPRCPATTPEGGNLVLSSCIDRIAAGEFVGPIENVPEDYSIFCTARCALADADLTVLPTATEVDANKAPRKWVERIGGQANIQGASLAEALACYAPLGIAGCGFEQPLEAMYRAIAAAQTPQSNNNYGFLREQSVLALALLSDETDCSHNPDHDAIFTTNKVFWHDPVNDPAPTSSLCWAAGVACEGTSPYTACAAEDYDEARVPGATDDAAVLFPVHKYIDYFTEIEQARQNYDPSNQVLVSLLTGVPIGYESHAAELVYADSLDPSFQRSYGVGPGCIGPPDAPTDFAIPPVREREFAEAFNVDPEAARNLSSVCDDDYSSALAALGDQIRDRLPPACMPSCVADTVPATPILDPSCQVFEENLITQTRTAIAGCVAGMSPMGQPDWLVPAGETVCFAQLVDRDGAATPEGLDDMSPACVAAGFNLEFRIVRAGPAPAGTTIAAGCDLSADKPKDCPNL